MNRGIPEEGSGTRQPILLILIDQNGQVIASGCIPEEMLNRNGICMLLGILKSECLYVFA